MCIEELKGIREQLASGKTLYDFTKEKDEEIRQLEESLRKMFNRCMVYTLGGMCEFCEFQNKCKKG